MATILVADDDAQVRLAIQTILSELGHEVLLAPDGEAALALYHRSEPDLVITDLVMPGLHGVPLVEQMSSGGVFTRIIAISGKGDEQLQRAKRAGAMATLKKPIDPDHLVTQVQRLLREKSWPE